jgi:adenylate kinase family enzyme
VPLASASVVAASAEHMQTRSRCHYAEAVRDDAAGLAEALRHASRIHIIGGPGSGKSTFARMLGARLGLPVHGLDEIAYEGPYFAPRRRDVVARRAREIAASPSWVAEGIFLGWTEPLLHRAEVIIWLDHIGWARAMTRILHRSARLAACEARARQGRERFLRFRDYGRNVRHFVRVAVTSRDYWSRRAHGSRYPATRAGVERALARHRTKTVRIGRREEQAALLASLAAARRSRACR